MLTRGGSIHCCDSLLTCWRAWRSKRGVSSKSDTPGIFSVMVSRTMGGARQLDRCSERRIAGNAVSHWTAAWTWSVMGATGFCVSVVPAAVDITAGMPSSQVLRGCAVVDETRDEDSARASYPLPIVVLSPPGSSPSGVGPRVAFSLLRHLLGLLESAGDGTSTSRGVLCHARFG